jgi:hypothetical protein
MFFAVLVAIIGKYHFNLVYYDTSFGVGDLTKTNKFFGETGKIEASGYAIVVKFPSIIFATLI